MSFYNQFLYKNFNVGKTRFLKGYNRITSFNINLKLYKSVLYKKYLVILFFKLFKEDFY